MSHPKDCDCKAPSTLPPGPEIKSSDETSATSKAIFASVKAMKTFLAQQGVSVVDITEKSDLVKRCEETLKKLQQDGSSCAASSNAIIHTKAVGPLSCNMVIIGDPETRNAVLVDPGGDGEAILKLISDLAVNIVQIVVTHGHFDHFLAADVVRKATKAPVFLHSADFPLWRMLPMQCMLIGLTGVAAIPDPDHAIADGDKLKVLDGVTIHTPGHSPGSVCFHFAREKLLCSGDTLFHLSVGRTDLMGGDSKAIQKSIQERLYTLPDDTKVIPGHGEFTSIGFEKKNNGVVRAAL